MNNIDINELNKRIKNNGGLSKSIKEAQAGPDPKGRWMVKAIKVLLIVGLGMFLYEGVTCPTGKHYESWCFSD